MAHPRSRSVVARVLYLINFAGVENCWYVRYSVKSISTIYPALPRTNWICTCFQGVRCIFQSLVLRT